ncbi:hypothetical protein [Candidatus Solincola sp.]
MRLMEMGDKRLLSLSVYQLEKRRQGLARGARPPPLEATPYSIFKILPGGHPGHPPPLLRLFLLQQTHVEVKPPGLPFLLMFHAESGDEPRGGFSSRKIATARVPSLIFQFSLSKRPVALIPLLWRVGKWNYKSTSSLPS